MHRFFACRTDINESDILLSAENIKHIRAVRLRPSERFIICDGQKTDYICVLGDSSESTAKIIEKKATSGEPEIFCEVYIAYAKGERLDFAVQKSVELGASEIILFPSERCIAVPTDATKKLARMQRISLEAAKQCGRGIIPAVISAETFPAAIGRAAKAELPILCYEDEKKLRLKAELESRADKPKTCSIVTGPEGGFTPDEAEFARLNGMVSVSLGPRILRSETAPIFALGAVVFWYEGF